MCANVVSLATLLKKLPRPRSDLARRILNPSGNWAPLNPEPTPSALFIEPTFTRLSGGDDAERCDVILVQAAAGVGKSLLANCMAVMSGNVLVNLSADLQVGANYYRGGLSKAYQADAWAISSAIADGEAALVIDGLDEALVAATVPNYDASLSDLAEVLRSRVDVDRSLASAVLLGRPDSVERAVHVLTAAGLRCDTYAINLFGEHEQAQLIGQLAERKFPGINRNQFDSLVAEFLSLIRATLGENELERRSFLGYAPVLDAISAMGESENLYAELASLRANEDRREAWSILAKIPMWLLLREQEKIAQAALPVDRTLASGWFDPTHQLEYLCSQDFDLSFPEISTNADHEQAARVRTLISSQLEIHPFLRVNATTGAPSLAFESFASPVFRDYTAAWAVTIGSDDALLSVLDGFDRQVISASPLLIRLIFSITDSSVHQPLRLDSSVLGVLCDSAAMEIGDASVHRVISLQGRLPDLGGHIIELFFRENDSVLGVAELELPRSGTLQLAHSLARARLDFPGIIIEAGAGATFSFEAPVEVSCERFVFGAASHYVRASHPAVVAINAASVSGGYHDVPIDRDDLLLTTDNAHFPWSRYVTGAYARPTAWPADLARAAVDLRSVLIFAFKTRMAGDLVRGPITYRYHATRNDDWVSFLTDRNILLTAGGLSFTGPSGAARSWYLLNPDAEWLQSAAASMRINDERYVSLLREYVAWKPNHEQGKKR